MRPMRRVTRAMGVLVLAVFAVLVHRGQWLGADRIAVTARFTDVVDLATDAGVRFNDVTVGGVGAIRLTSKACPQAPPCAEVELLVDADTPVPRDVRADLAKTSVLGERYVALVPLSDDWPCCLADGDELAHTSVRTDVEALVGAGSGMLASVSSDALRTTLETGAAAVGGRGDLVTRFVEDLHDVVATYQQGHDDVLELIAALDRATGAHAGSAADNAATLADLRTAAAVLQEQDDRLLDTLDTVTALSDEATTFLSEHQGELQNAVRRARLLLDQVEEADDDLRGILAVGGRWMSLLPRGEVNGEGQVWVDGIMCGINDDQGDVDEDCTPPNAGRRAPGPGYYPVPEACWRDPEPCTGRPD